MREKSIAGIYAEYIWLKRYFFPLFDFIFVRVLFNTPGSRYPPPKQYLNMGLFFIASDTFGNFMLYLVVIISENPGRALRVFLHAWLAWRPLFVIRERSRITNRELRDKIPANESVKFRAWLKATVHVETRCCCMHRYIRARIRVTSDKRIGVSITNLY